MPSFYIKNRDTGKYLVRIPTDTKPIVWGSSNEAKPFESKLVAEAQVLLLEMK